MSPVVPFIRQLPERGEEHGVGAHAVPVGPLGVVHQLSQECAHGGCPFLLRITACRRGCWYRAE